MHHGHLLDGRFVSAPEPRLSPYALGGVAILPVGGVSSSPIKRLEGHTPTRQPKVYCVEVCNKNFGNIILLHSLL